MSRARILVAVRDSVPGTDLTRSLTILGYTIAVAAASGEALRLAEQLRPDLALIDLKLPGPPDGLAVASKLQGMNLPVVLLVPRGDPALEQALSAGISGIALLPADTAHLRTAIELALAHHRAEEAAHNDAHRLTAVLNAMPEAVFATDAAGQVSFLNSAAAALVHCAPAEAAGRPLAQLLRLLDEQTRQPISDPISWALHTGQTGAYALLENDDRTVSVTAGQCAALTDAPATVLVLRDATEMRQTEGALRLAEKMAATEQLAAGVAHHFNNLLTVVNGYSDLLSNSLDPTHPWRPFLEEVHKAGERAADITRQLLAFSRKQFAQTHVLDLNQLVSKLAPVIRNRLGDRIELRLDLGHDVPSVRVDPELFEQMLLALAANAHEAMPHGGTVAVQTSGVVLAQEQTAKRPGLYPGRHACLQFRDSGRGMPEAVRARAFEPFFTTKPVGQGTGLGLASVYGIVQQSAGHIEMASDPGNGTAFTIYLPAAKESRGPLSLTMPNLPQGSETVLLAEDEPMVRKLNRQVLQMCGYTVLEGVNGIEALRVCEAHDGPVDLIVTDVLMPGMSGPELVHAVTATRPNVKVLFLSGMMTRDAQSLDLDSLAPGTGFLAKPYSPTDLAQKVRELLSGSP